MGVRFLLLQLSLLALSLATSSQAFLGFDLGALFRHSSSSTSSSSRIGDGDEAVFLWPMPSEVAYGNSMLRLHPDLAFVPLGGATNSSILSEAFARYKHLMFRHHTLTPPEEEDFSIVSLERVLVNVSSGVETLQLGVDESYHLSVPALEDTSVVYLEANTIYGALRGLETLSQLCIFNYTKKAVEVSNTPWQIRDAPRFQFRGLLIDTSRHYLPVDVIKQVIESMAYSKLNVLHWHMVDEESFPLEIPSYPNLWRGSYTRSERYTTDDALEIVEFARARGINVMAEIDVPGHAESWGFGYPQLWPSNDCREPLDVSKNFTFEVIDGILSDMRKIFPFGLFHLGGDEVNTGCWKTSQIETWLNNHQMTRQNAYEYFVLRAQAIAISHGWDPVNWEETFNGFSEKLHPRTIVHNWLGSNVAPKVVAKGLRCIVSNQDAWYLDHLDSPWERFYMNEPLKGITEPTQQELVLGGEVCMWGETADTSDVQQTIWPRAAAAAERLWSQRNFTERGAQAAMQRLQFFRCLLNSRNIAASPVYTKYGRKAPTGPGSCYAQ